MALDLMKITAALNAYPWAAGTLTTRSPDAAQYCAVGLLLRFAGVTQEQMACASNSTTAVWPRYAELLRTEYGITDCATIRAIIVANDSAATHGEAIQRVQDVLSRIEDGGAERLTLTVDSRIAAVEPYREDGGDEGSSCGAIVA